MQLYAVLIDALDLLKHHWRSFFPGAFLTTLILIPCAWSGQVINDQDRAWAKNVLKEEASLAPVKAANTVAVLNFRNTTDNQELDPFQKGVAIMLITDLAKIKQLTLVERTRIQALQDEMTLAQSGLVEQTATSKTGKLLGAHFVIGGDFLKGGKKPLKLSSDVLNITRPEAMKKIFSEGEVGALLTLEKEIAFKIVAILNIELSSKEKEALKEPLSTNMRALAYLFQGVDLSDKGKYHTAKRCYDKAIQLDPGLGMARQAAAELIHLKLAREPAKTDAILNRTQERTTTIREQGFDNRLKQSVTESPSVIETTDIHVKW